MNLIETTIAGGCLKLEASRRIETRRANRDRKRKSTLKASLETTRRRLTRKQITELLFESCIGQFGKKHRKHLLKRERSFSSVCEYLFGTDPLVLVVSFCRFKMRRGAHSDLGERKRKESKYIKYNQDKRTLSCQLGAIPIHYSNRKRKRALAAIVMAQT